MKTKLFPFTLRIHHTFILPIDRPKGKNVPHTGKERNKFIFQNAIYHFRHHTKI